MIEEALRALLVDDNVPARVPKRVVQEALVWWMEADIARRERTMDFARRYVLDNFDATSLSGPIVAGLPRKVSVSRMVLAERIIEGTGFAVAALEWTWAYPL